MFQPVSIAPSILSADFMHLSDQVDLIAKGGADYIHVDVMDGHFVPNLTIGVPHVAQLKRITALPLDVHLMISNPMEQVPWFINAGADLITVHAETLEGQWMDRAVSLVHDGGKRIGIAVKPHTPVSVLEPVIASLDMVLVMSVEPGFSGQSFIDGSQDKVAEIVRMAKEVNPSLLIEVDGGMSEATVGCVCETGADVIVCGNAVFKAEDPAMAIAQVRDAGIRAQRAAYGAGAKA